MKQAHLQGRACQVRASARTAESVKRASCECRCQRNHQCVTGIWEFALIRSKIVLQGVLDSGGQLVGVDDCKERGNVLCLGHQSWMEAPGKKLEDIVFASVIMAKQNLPWLWQVTRLRIHAQQ